jgi:hypothetical protein
LVAIVASPPPYRPSFGKFHYYLKILKAPPCTSPLLQNLRYLDAESALRGYSICVTLLQNLRYLNAESALEILAELKISIHVRYLN